MARDEMSLKVVQEITKNFTSAEEKERQFKGRHCRAWRKNQDIAGRGVRQQKNKREDQRAGTRPLAISMFRRNVSAQMSIY